MPQIDVPSACPHDSRTTAALPLARDDERGIVAAGSIHVPSGEERANRVAAAKCRPPTSCNLETVRPRTRSGALYDAPTWSWFSMNPTVLLRRTYQEAVMTATAGNGSGPGGDEGLNLYSNETTPATRGFSKIRKTACIISCLRA